MNDDWIVYVCKMFRSLLLASTVFGPPVWLLIIATYSDQLQADSHTHTCVVQWEGAESELTIGHRVTISRTIHSHSLIEWINGRALTWLRCYCYRVQYLKMSSEHVCATQHDDRSIHSPKTWPVCSGTMYYMIHWFGLRQKGSEK